MECSSASYGSRAAYDDDAEDTEDNDTTDTVPEDIIVRQELDVLITEDDLIEESVLSGSLTRLPALGSRTVCVFLSSTFSDMSPERNALMEHVYPQLKEFCRQEYQLEFRMMDLRWGIREQSHDDHTIIEFCLREIDKCRAKSLGPNFVALIGQKYGYRPFPPTICAREFEAIRDQFVSDERHKRALELLDTWFKKNTNILPHVYVLQPISSLIPDYADNIDAGRKQKAVEEWESINNQLRHILRQGVTSCVQSGCLPFPCRDKYFTSVTEYEINQGMFSVPVPVCNLSTLCFMRHITNLEDNIFHVKSRHYLDLVPGVSGDATSAVEVDREAQSLLCALRDKIPQSLTDERNLEYFELEWNTGSETNPSDDSSYLKRFCDSFRDKMQWLISRAAAKRGPACVLDADQSDHGYLHTKTVEVIQHMTMCQERSAEFRGREDTLRHLRLYIHHQQQNTQASWDDDVNCDVQMSGLMTNRPLVVYGQSGSGKTAVMAKVASLVKQWFSKDGPDPIVILRFLGTTSQSCNIRLLLSSICWQIAAAYKFDASRTLPTDYPDLVVYFNELLQMVATNDRPLIMILDGLDQLGSAHRAYSLAWLPIVLPSNVRLVVSVLRHTTHELFETLEALLPYSPMNFVLIPSLGAELSVNVVKERLYGVNRTLTPTQLEIVEKALAECSLPLYTCLVFEEVCRWSSFDLDTKLESTVDDIINTFFDRLELYHGKVFVAHTLSYLTASRDGLSDAELEDVLSLDDTVLNDVFQHWLPPLRRIPPLLIPRLLDELGRYVVRREAHGVDVIYWYHGQFIAVARRRYLCVSEQHRRAIHSTLAHYYLGTWAAGSRKPFRYSTKQLRCQSGGRGGGKPRRLEDEADRMVAQQPLFFGTESCDSRSSSSSAPGSSRPVNYNLRKLYELPFHLVESRMFTELRKNVLFNYEWLHAKLCATSLPDVLADFQMTINCLHDMDPVVKAVVSENVQLLAGALRVGGSHLSHNPDTLAFDLLGRLLHHYNDSDVIVRGDDNNNGKDGENDKNVLRGRSKSKFGASVKSLLQQCDVVSPKHSALLPVLHCFDPPTAMSLYILEGHSQMVSDMTFSSTTNELLTVSKDGTLMFWDLESGERSRSVDVSDKLPGRCTRIYMTDSNAIVVDFDRLESLAFTYDVKTGRELHICGRPRLPSPLRGFVTGNLLCRQKVLVDVNTGEELFMLDEFIESKSYALCVVTPDMQSLLVGEYFGTRLFDLKRPTSGQLSGRHQWIACFPSDNQPSAIAVSSDSQRAFIGYAVDCELHVIDIDVTSCTFGQVLLKFSYRDHIDPTATSQAPSGESNCEQLFPNEITEINVCLTNDVTRVLLNICRLLLVILRLNSTSTVVEDFCFLEQPCSTGNRDIVLTSSCFNYDGQLVLACGETYLLVWSADCGNLIHRISLHTTAGYPLAIHPSRNLVATGSTIRTAVMVWDLDKTQTSDVTDLKVYDGPVDCIAVAADARLVFIKNHHSLSSSNRNFLHFWWFGVDVWNISTGTCQSVLPFNNYGRLMQMSASPEGDRLALLLVNVSHSSHVIVFSISSGATAIPSGLSGLRRKSARQEVICVAKHEHCSEFLLSPRWNFMATVSVASVSVGDQSNSENEIRLWDLHSTKANSAVVVFKEATSPTFSMNSTYLLYIDCGRTIIAYSLTSMAPKYRVPDCNAHQLIASPANNYVVMATLLKRQHKEGIDVPVLRTALVTICDFKTRSVHRVFGVAASGLVDISADGKLAVDGHVQVFDLQTGNLRAAFETHHAVLSSEEHARKLIRLTADGRYVAWIETSQVRVGRVCDSVIVACTSTHERPTSLESMDSGYVLVVGREDGRLLTMKLVADRQLRSSHKYFDLDERRRSILSEMDGVGDTSSWKPNQRRPTSIPDKSMPAASEPVISAILRLADVPVSVIDTSHRSVNQLRDYRRSLDVAPRSTTAIPKSGNSFSAVDHVSSGHIRIDIIARSATPSPAVSRSDLTTVAMAASGSTHSIGDLFRFNGLLTSYRRLSRNSAKRSRSAVDLYRLDRSVDKLDVYVSSSDICSTMTKSCYLQTTPEQVTRSKPSSVRHSSSRLSAAKDRFRNLFRSSSDKLNRSKR